MPIRSILLLVFFIPSAGFGQIKYENGYFISNDDNKIECLIKNNDWSSNPLEFRYKSQASNDNVITANIKVVKEFGVANSKYIRANVKIDKSKEDANLLTNNGNPEWVEQEVFLEVLVEGQVNLYSYKERNLERYFYSTDGSTIHQLVYKVFRFKNDQMGFNREFINQLKSISGCTSLPTSLAERINYHSKGDWIDYFERYDECKGTKSIYYDSKHKIDINLRFTPGIDNSFIDVQTEFLTIPFDKIQNARIGMELEFVLPINKGKWSVIAEPTYRYYRQTNEKYVNFFIDYRSIELPIGLRHNFFLGEYSKIFVNGAVVFDIDLNYTILMRRYYILRTEPNLAAGLGFSHKKLGIEFRYYSPRNLTIGTDWYTDYKKNCLILSYKIF